MKLERVVLGVLIVLMAVTMVHAHGKFLYTLELDYDPELKQGVLDAAAQYTGLDEDILQFDYDRELIRVQYDRVVEYSVAIHPVTFEVYGFRDDSLAEGSRTGGLSDAEQKAIAQELFDALPIEYAQQLKYGDMKKLYNGVTHFIWYRYNGEVLVLGDTFEVEVNPKTGTVVSWRRGDFYYSLDQMQVTPAITGGVADQYAQLRMQAEPMDFIPLLVINDARPVWVTRVKGYYPIYVQVDAQNGRLVKVGTLDADLPTDYSYGMNAEVVENDLIQEMYGK